MKVKSEKGNVFLFSITFLLSTFHLPLSTLIYADTTTAAQFLRETINARQVGMGGTFSATANDSYSVQTNPAGLTLLNRPEMNFSYSSTQDQSRYAFTGYAHPLVQRPSFQMGIGVGLAYYSAGNIDINYLDGTTRSFNAETSYASSLGLAVRFPKWLAVGFSPKYIRSTLVQQFTAAAIAADFGIMVFPFPEFLKERVTIGGAVQNIGPKISYKTLEHQLPRTDSAGLAFRFFDGEEFGAALASVQAERVLGEKVRVRLGGEYGYGRERAVFLRGGYRLHFESEDYSIGAGFRDKNFQLDYSFVNGLELEKTHRMTLLFRFGKFIEKQKPVRHELIDPEQEKLPLQQKEINLDKINRESKPILMEEGNKKDEEYYLIDELEKRKKLNRRR